MCFGAVLPMFLHYYLFFSLPKLSQKNSLDVRSGVFGLFFSPPLVFFRRRRRPFRVFFLRETAQVVTGHTPTRTLHSCFFFLSVSPPQPGLSPVLAVRPFFSGVLSGCHSGPRAFLCFLDSLGTWGG